MFELNNEQRKYVGLDPILPHWDRVLLAGDKHRPESILYFDGDIIKRQIISTKENYIEKQYEEATRNRETLLPKTSKGKEVPLQANHFEKRTPIGVWVEIKNDRLAITSYTSEITFYDTLWEKPSDRKQTSIPQQIADFIAQSPANHLEEIAEFKQQKRKHVKFKKGDIFCFKLNRTQYGFGRVVLDIKPYKNRIWLATDGGGVSVFNPADQRFFNIQHSAGNVHSIPVNSITVLYEDPNHNMWAGTVRDGVFLFKETYIKTYTDSALGSNNGLSERAVISLYEAPNGILWIGTDGGGINAFNPQTEHFTHHLYTYTDKVSSITYFSPNELLVSLYSKGLFIYNTNARKYTPFLLRDETTNQQECHTGFTPFVYRINNDLILITAKNTYL
ncbi:MAG: two-component regulator propeller domain-containing protein, partial [Capnocytophaga endodontalis]